MTLNLKKINLNWKWNEVWKNKLYALNKAMMTEEKKWATISE